MDEHVDLTPSMDEIGSITDAVDAVEMTMDRFLAVADVDSVFAEPIEHGDITVIPCAEVLAGVGFGLGYGYGQGEGPAQKEGEEKPSGSGGGGGGGGGGRTFARPVAVIVSSPQGVRVEPIVDVTKIALAAFTAGGFMLAMLARMIRRQPPDFAES